MIKESRLHEQLQASLEKKGERLVELTFGIRTRGSDSKDLLCRQRRFLAFQLAPSLKKKKGTFNLSLSRKQFNHRNKALEG